MTDKIHPCSAHMFKGMPAKSHYWADEEKTIFKKIIIDFFKNKNTLNWHRCYLSHSDRVKMLEHLSKNQHLLPKRTINTMMIRWRDFLRNAHLERIKKRLTNGDLKVLIHVMHKIRASRYKKHARYFKPVREVKTWLIFK